MIQLLSVLIIFTAPDTLPPLPEPSELPVNEPPLWTELPSSRFFIPGYAGGRFGGVFKFISERDSIETLYQNENDWCLTRYARLSAQKRFSVGPCDLTPEFDAMGAFMGLYRYSFSGSPEPSAVYQLGYGLSSVVYIPAAVFEAGATQRIWRIEVDSADHYEHQGRLMASFDRLRLLPQIDLSVLGQDSRWRTEGALHFHAGVLHIGLSSMVRPDSPSPGFEVCYRDVENTVGIRVKQGYSLRPFLSIVDPQLLIHYDYPGPEERVGWMVEISGHRASSPLTVGAGYRRRHDWDRCALDNEHHLILVAGVEENAAFAVLACSLTAGPVGIRDSCGIEYEKLDPAIPFIPRYEIANDLTITYGALEAAVVLRYYSDRPGVVAYLPRAAVALLASRVGVRIRPVTVFVSVYNITNRRTEMYDGFPMWSRTVAAGLEFNRP